MNTNEIPGELSREHVIERLRMKFTANGKHQIQVENFLK